VAAVADQAKAAQTRDSLGELLGRVMRVREFALILILLVISTAVTIREPRFLQGDNLEQVALSGTLVCIVTLGEALVILARQIDLSVGPMVAMSAFVAADWLEAHPTGNVLIAYGIGCGLGIGLGIVNGVLVGFARIPAIVATLGTMAIYRGVAIVVAGGRQISATVLPDGYQSIAQSHFLGVPVLVWIAIILTLVLGWMGHYTRFGRNLYALGSNPQSAQFVGISESVNIFFVFVLSGLLCGFVGVLWGARFGTVDAVMAPDLHFQAISAVVIGGVSIFGGSGSLFGAALGAVIFAVLQNGVQIVGINQFWLDAVTGATIVGAVIFYTAIARRADRAERESRREAALARVGAQADARK
jgi:rhamnose transport system permease protein